MIKRWDIRENTFTTGSVFVLLVNGDSDSVNEIVKQLSGFCKLTDIKIPQYNYVFELTGITDDGVLEKFRSKIEEIVSLSVSNGSDFFSDKTVLSTKFTTNTLYSTINRNNETFVNTNIKPQTEIKSINIMDSNDDDAPLQLAKTVLITNRDDADLDIQISGNNQLEECDGTMIDLGNASSSGNLMESLENSSRKPKINEKEFFANRSKDIEVVENEKKQYVPDTQDKGKNSLLSSIVGNIFNGATNKTERILTKDNDNQLNNNTLDQKLSVNQYQTQQNNKQFYKDYKQGKEDILQQQKIELTSIGNKQVNNKLQVDNDNNNKSLSKMANVVKESSLFKEIVYKLFPSLNKKIEPIQVSSESASEIIQKKQVEKQNINNTNNISLETPKEITPQENSVNDTIPVKKEENNPFFNLGKKKAFEETPFKEKSIQGISPISADEEDPEQSLSAKIEVEDIFAAETICAFYADDNKQTSNDISPKESQITKNNVKTGVPLQKTITNTNDTFSNVEPLLKPTNENKSFAQNVVPSKEQIIPQKPVAPIKQVPTIDKTLKENITKKDSIVGQDILKERKLASSSQKNKETSNELNSNISEKKEKINMAQQESITKKTTLALDNDFAFEQKVNKDEEMANIPQKNKISLGTLSSNIPENFEDINTKQQEDFIKKPTLTLDNDFVFEQKVNKDEEMADIPQKNKLSLEELLNEDAKTLIIEKKVEPKKETKLKDFLDDSKIEVGNIIGSEQKNSNKEQQIMVDLVPKTHQDKLVKQQVETKQVQDVNKLEDLAVQKKYFNKEIKIGEIKTMSNTQKEEIQNHTSQQVKESNQNRNMQDKLDHTLHVAVQKEVKKSNWPIEMPFNPSFVFNNMDMSSNRFAHATAMSIVDNLGTVNNPFLIYGESGTGKTHFLNALGYEITKRIPQENILYTNGVRMSRGLQRYVEDGKEEKLKEFLESIQVLIIDDIHLTAVNEQNRDLISYILNDFLKKKKQILISSKYPPESLVRFEELVKFNLSQGWVSEVKSPASQHFIRVCTKLVKDASLEIREDQIKTFFLNNATNLGSVARDIKRGKVLHRRIESSGKMKKSYEEILNEMFAINGENKNSEILQKDFEDIVTLEKNENTQWGKFGFFFPSDQVDKFKWLAYATQQKARELGIRGGFSFALKSSYSTEHIISSAFKIANICDNKGLKGAIILGPSLLSCKGPIRENFYDILSHMLEVMMIRCGIVDFEAIRRPSAYVKLLGDVLK